MLTKTGFRQLPIFITSMSRWDGDLSSASLALAKVFSRTNPVYYIDFPYTYADVLREYRQPSVKQRMPALLWGQKAVRCIGRANENLAAATPPLVLPFYSLPAGASYAALSHYNNRRMAAMVKKIRSQNSIGDFLFINSFNPSYLSNINRYLRPTLSVYHSRDAIEAINERAIPRENDCVRHYDISLATSRQLCKNIEARTQKGVHYFPNGGDVALFRTAIETSYPMPPELQHLQKPIIGYTGAVCQRIDYELLVKIARAHPDKSIVLVGPRRDKQFTGINLDSIPNIVFTGARKLEELPAYLQHFNAAIIPFAYTTFTAGIYPLKLNEYLAAGKAVVTTAFSEDIASFGKQVYLAPTHDDFLAQLNKALKENQHQHQQERLGAALENSWEGRVEKFWDLAWEAYQEKCSRSIVSTPAL